VGRDVRWIGIFDNWGWGFGEFGRLGGGEEGEGGEVKSRKGKGKREKPEDGFAARWGLGIRPDLLFTMYDLLFSVEAPQLLVIGSRLALGYSIFSLIRIISYGMLNVK